MLAARPKIRWTLEDAWMNARIDADAVWDAGDMGCGELVLALRTRLAAMAPGQVLELIACDPGAPADLPAWCRMTGHTLLALQHPVYRIKRKER